MIKGLKEAVAYIDSLRDSEPAVTMGLPDLLAIHTRMISTERDWKVLRSLLDAIPVLVEAQWSVGREALDAFIANNHVRGIIYVPVSRIDFRFTDEETAALFRLNFA